MRWINWDRVIWHWAIFYWTGAFVSPTGNLSTRSPVRASGQGLLWGAEPGSNGMSSKKRL